MNMSRSAVSAARSPAAGLCYHVLAHLAGKMRRFRIKVVLGDRVTVGVTPYDPTRGRIVYRAR